MDNSIVPAHLAVKAMRDNGYKNAAYAIAELIDNSVQHGASLVDLMCLETEVKINSRTVDRVNKIALLDNGSGMDKATLRMALQFGNGTHLDSANQKGIGKFGMGLPSSSISQAKKVEVWTWQNGIANAIYSYLDIDEIINQTQKSVPEPILNNVSTIWIKDKKTIGNSGTLVLWSNIDRCIWKTAKAIFQNSEFLIGRMYRKFLESGKVKIRMISFLESKPQLLSIQEAKPNDPLYLMEKTSCPAPFDNVAMFNKWGEDNFEIKFDINYAGNLHQVYLRFSLAKEEARSGVNPGAKPHGRHAANNIGVSIIRANRELDLDQSWVIQYDPRERWWGLEIEFPPALDEIFGVTNNKQFAINFSELGKIDLQDLLSDGKTLIQLKEDLLEEDDPKGLLIDIAQKINSQLSIIRGILKAQTQNQERTEKNRYLKNLMPEKTATEATEERVKEGHTGTSDRQENEKDEEYRKAEVISYLNEDGITNSGEVVDWLFKNNLKYQFVESDFDGSAFFTVKSKGGKIIISLNTNHPAYNKLVEVLEKNTENQKIEELQNRLANASEGLKLLLMAWARYEDEQIDGKPKTISQDARQDWGKIARKFFQEDQ